MNFVIRFTSNNRVAHNRLMATEPTQHPLAMPAAAPLIFEQPLNERMRTFLRLDFLYSQALHHNQGESSWGSRAAMSGLLDILAITSRSDVRADVLKELERQLVIFNEFQNKAGVDTARLKAIITNLVRLRNDLAASGSAYPQSLKDSEFLSAIRHRSAIPGGTCEFDLPDYFYWLNKPDAERAEAFGAWLILFRPLCDAIAELLWLTRQNGKARREVAAGGVFNITFDRDAPVQMIRIALPGESALYPEISGSHYRCSIRFLTWAGLRERARQADGDIEFELTCCA